MTATTIPQAVTLTHDDPDCTCCTWCVWMWAECPLIGCEHTK